MDIEYVIEYLMINLFFIYILDRFMSIFYVKKKIRGWKNFFTLSICYMINSGGNLLSHNPIINMLTSSFSTFLISCMYKSYWIKRVTITFMIYSICIICDIAVATVIGDYIIGKKLSVVNNIVSYLLIFSVEIILEKYVQLKDDSFILKKQIIIVAGVPFVSLMIICVLVLYKINMSGVILGVSVGLLFINILVFRLYDLLSSSYEEKYRNVLLKREIVLLEREILEYKNQFMLISESQKRIEGLKHDFKHHVLALENLARNKSYDEILKYLENMRKFAENKNVYVKSGNNDIDSILNYFIQNARNKDIKVLSDIKIGKEIKINFFDLNVILGNLMENAIDGGIESREKIIMLSIEFDRDILYIQVKNSFVKKVKVLNNIIITSKKNKEGHGFGLKNIKYIVEQYNGQLEVNYDEKYFEVDVLLYLRE